MTTASYSSVYKSSHTRSYVSVQSDVYTVANAIILPLAFVEEQTDDRDKLCLYRFAIRVFQLIFE